MRLTNLIRPGDKVDLLMSHNGEDWLTVVVEEIGTAKDDDWNTAFHGRMCVWWNRGSNRWPVTLCRKAEQ